MANENLEAISGTSEYAVACHNPGCNKSYDLLEREEQILGIAHPNTAAYYCSDKCWIEDTCNEDDLLN
jgi:hypothetical protein